MIPLGMNTSDTARPLPYAEPMTQVIDVSTYRRNDAARPPARPMLWREAVGHQFRIERRRRKRTLAEVATDAGVSTQYLSEVERGRKEPSSEIVEAIAAALGLDLGEVAGRVSRALRTTSEPHLAVLTSQELPPGDGPQLATPPEQTLCAGPTPMLRAA